MFNPEFLSILVKKLPQYITISVWVHFTDKNFTDDPFHRNPFHRQKISPTENFTDREFHRRKSSPMENFTDGKFHRRQISPTMKNFTDIFIFFIFFSNFPENLLILDYFFFFQIVSLMKIYVIFKKLLFKIFRNEKNLERITSEI
jgi:hypothetical protein